MYRKTKNLGYILLAAVSCSFSLSIALDDVLFIMILSLFFFQKENISVHNSTHKKKSFSYSSCCYEKEEGGGGENFSLYTFMLDEHIEI